MNLKSYLKSWEGTQNENKWGRMFIAGLIVAVLVLIGMLANKQTIVTIQPFTLHDEAWVTEDDSSQGYKEAWGFALAQLFGNVTPSNVGLIACFRPLSITMWLTCWRCSLSKSAMTA